jgi:hypothetical protein
LLDGVDGLHQIVAFNAALAVIGYCNHLNLGNSMLNIFPQVHWLTAIHPWNCGFNKQIPSPQHVRPTFTCDYESTITIHGSHPEM